MNVESIAVALGLIAVIIYATNKLQLLSKIAVVFLAVVFTFLVMSLVPALQIEPVYGWLKGFFEWLPNLFNGFVSYIQRFLGLGWGGSA